jgi:hypothetical protein
MSLLNLVFDSFKKAIFDQDLEVAADEKRDVFVHDSSIDSPLVNATRKFVSTPRGLKKRSKSLWELNQVFKVFQIS